MGRILGLTIKNLNSYGCFPIQAGISLAFEKAVEMLVSVELLLLAMFFCNRSGCYDLLLSS